MKTIKRFQMIREFHLADWFTLGNAACGIGALFSTMTYLQIDDVRHLLLACGLIPLAMVFDVLDGRIARWRQKQTGHWFHSGFPGDFASHGRRSESV